MCTVPFNSLTTGRCGSYFQSVIFEHILWIKFMDTFCEIALKWMPQNTLLLTHLTLVQIMAWCHQAYSQCWPRSMFPYGITRPQWTFNNTVRIAYNTEKYALVIILTHMWFINAPVDWIIVGSDNGWHQTMMNSWLTSPQDLRNKLQWNFNQNT